MRLVEAVRARLSKTFVENDREFLAECLTARSSGIPLSIRLGVRDELVGWDLDRAACLRLLYYDNEGRAGDKLFLASLLVDQESLEKLKGELSGAQEEQPEVW